MAIHESPEESYSRAVAALTGAGVKRQRVDGKMLSIVCSPCADAVVSPAGFIEGALMCSGCGRSEKVSPEDLDGVAKEAKGRHEAE